MPLPTKVSRVSYNDPMNDVQHELDGLLGRLFGGQTSPQTTNGRRSAPYPVDVHEDENHLYFSVELPGFKKDEIDITLDNNVLTISAERTMESQKDSKGDSKRETLLNERRYTYFSRSFSLPPTVSNDEVRATLEEGVLNLTLNKREESKPRKISVS